MGEREGGVQTPPSHPLGSLTFWLLILLVQLELPALPSGGASEELGSCASTQQFIQLGASRERPFPVGQAMGKGCALMRGSHATPTFELPPPRP